MVANTSNDVNGNIIHQLNYVTTNRFYVEIGSTIAASFTECSGLGVTIDKTVYSEGGVNDQQRIILNHAQLQMIRTFGTGSAKYLKKRLVGGM